MADLPETTDPLLLFDAWLQLATESEFNDPNAVALATASADGQPTVRMVLAKQVGEERFCFFTNAESRKGNQIAQNPRAAMCFHWKTLRRQIRVEGHLTELPTQASDQYFHSRSRDSQIGAAISDQSRPLLSREALEARFEAFAASHPSEAGEIPRPAYWRGYCLHPDTIEFWINGPNRLHDRFLFTQVEGQWRQQRLYP